jgi:hypothetical protein
VTLPYCLHCLHTPSQDASLGFVNGAAYGQRFFPTWLAPVGKKIKTTV